MTLVLPCEDRDEAALSKTRLLGRLFWDPESGLGFANVKSSEQRSAQDGQCDAPGESSEGATDCSPG